MGVYDENIGAFRKRGKFAIGGVADLLSIVDIDGIGVSVFLEVKTSSGKQSPKQKAFEIAVKRNNGFYSIVRSVEDAVNYIEGVKNVVRRNIKERSYGTEK